MATIRAWLPVVARVLLGLVFFVFGLNGFLHFLPQPPHPGPAGAFLGALAATGYMFPLIKATEVVGGALLLAGRAVPFALVLLAPVIVNILGFHVALAPEGAGMAAALVLLEGYLAWLHRGVFAPLFRAQRAPADESSAARLTTRSAAA